MIKPFKEILVLPKERIIFLLSAKCASTSVRRLALDTLHYRNRDDKVYAGLQYLQVNDLPKYEGFKKIMITRNPYSRLVSIYEHKVVDHLHKTFSDFDLFRNMPFESFVKRVVTVPDEKADPHFTSQTALFNVVKPELLIPLERINSLWRLTGLPKIQKRNSHGKGIDWTFYYNSDLRYLVWKRYRKYFELLNYTP